MANLKVLNAKRWTRQTVEVATIRALGEEGEEVLGFHVHQGKLYVGELEVVPREDVDRVLQELYDDPRTGANPGRDRLYARVKERYVGISRRRVQDFLRQQETYQLHLAVRRQRVVQPVVASRPLERWQMDLIDLSEFKAVNNGYQYALTVVDVFSKHAWARALKNKEGRTVARALERVLEDSEGGVPHVLQSDRGSEFVCEDVRSVLEVRGVRQVLSLAYKPQSNGGIERWNRTLKRMVFAHFTQWRTRRWVEVLELLLENYNSAVHSVTRMRPDVLHACEDEEMLAVARERIARKAEAVLRKSRRTFEAVRVGDWVRIASSVHPDHRKNKVFAKRYLPNWSQELYRVTHVSQPEGEWAQPQYRVEDERGRALGRRFYRDNLQKVDRERLVRNAVVGLERWWRGGGGERLFDLERHLRRLAQQRVGAVWVRKAPGVRLRNRRLLQRKFTLEEIGLVRGKRKGKQKSRKI